MGPGKLVPAKYREHLPSSYFDFLRTGDHSHLNPDCELRMVEGVVRLTAPREEWRRLWGDREPHTWYYRQYTIKRHAGGGWEAMGDRGKVLCPERVRARTLARMREVLDMKIEHEYRVA